MHPLRTAALALAPLVAAASVAAQTPEVIRSTGPGAWGASVRLVEQLRIGLLDGDEAYTFSSIRDVLPGANGTIWIAESRPARIRIYDARGRFMRNVGREGEGPGEYRQIDGMRPLNDGGMAILDGRNGRITVYAPDGELRASHRFPVSYFSSDIFNVDRSGNFYVKAPARPSQPGQFSLDRDMVWIRIDPAGNVVDSIAIPSRPAPVVQVYGGPYDSRVDPLVAGLSPLGYFVTGDPVRYAFDVHRPGQRVLRVEREHRPVPLARAERAEWEAMAEYLSQQPIGMSMRVVNGRPDTLKGPTVRYTVPATKPAWRGITFDQTGGIWIERYVAAERRPPAPSPPNSSATPARSWFEPRTYDVFEPDGRFLGTLVAPANVAFRGRVGTQLFATLRGEFDEQYVVVYRIETVGR